jgi:hypothetical protein
MDNNQKSNLSPVAAGITGFILGVVGTAAVAMSDKNTRTKVTQKANVMKDKMEKWSKDTLHDLQATGEDVKRKSATSADVKTQSANPADEAKQRLEEALNENRKEL